MCSALVIVESPAKSKTLERYLGKEYKVMASYGHVRDLLPKSGAVNPDDNFAMKYEPIEKNARAVNDIAKALKKVDILYLATDPDREGEAISWHLHELLKERGCLDDKQVHRIVFHEITKSAVQESIKHPRDLAINLINAQQARRALDYLVGFNLSPLLWKKIARGLSAGRVQSPALRMIVERETEIRKFVPREYWTIGAQFAKDKQSLVAKLTEFQGDKIKQFSVENEDQAATIKQTLLAEANGTIKVTKITKSQRKRQPAPPFITSTLQQEAARKLGFSTKKTMVVAQQLYEGMDLGNESVGLISYMRTDSVTIAEEALTEIRAFISKQYGEGFLPPQAKRYKTKSKNAQEAHEAIRPTSVNRLPEKLQGILKQDQFKLYQLIWKRAVACQMKEATMNTVAIDLSTGTAGLFRLTGSVIADPGFMKVYLEGQDDTPPDEEKVLPDFKEGDEVPLNDIQTDQHFTEPPPRYSEASLVKSLEEYGIGRPSTYASIISTLQYREYVVLEKKRFHPTDIGDVVSQFLTNHFYDYVDYEFTARLEDSLDAVSRGEKEWLPLMESFWQPFNQTLQDKSEHISRSEAVQAKVLGKDPKTGLEVSVRIGRYGPYAQIGTKDDEDKPTFASLKKEQRIDSINLEEALALFNLPRILGATAQGDEIAASIGRYGPYIRYGKKFVSMKEDDPYTIDLDRAFILIAQKEEADANREIRVFAEQNISVLNGRYGPYVTDGKKNAKVPKGDDPKQLDLKACQEILAKAPAKKKRGKR